VSRRIPKEYQTNREKSDRVIQEALEFKKKHGYAYLIIEKCTQLVFMYEALWACQMRSNQSIAVHMLPWDYYEIKDVNDFLNRIGKNYG
jgi:hypothetical protein